MRHLSRSVITAVLLLSQQRNNEVAAGGAIIAHGDNEDRTMKVKANGREICVDPKYFPNLGTGKNTSTSSSTTVSSSSLRPNENRSSNPNIFEVTGNEVVKVYSQTGCSGEVVSFPVSHEESKCTYCWDSCGEKFSDGSDAHTNIRSIRVPEGVVAVSMSTCVGSFGYSDPGYRGVLEPGCQDLVDEFQYVVHFYFAAETSTPGRYEYLGAPEHSQGHFESQMSTEHWMYGPDGIDNAQGTSWYQYIFELLDPTKKRMAFQVGIGGTWLGPTQAQWNVGDPCRCSPLDWPATGDGETCNRADLTKCTNGCCGTNGCGGLLQTMEGGLGYWLGKLPTPRAKWTIGSSVKCYKYWSNSPLEVANSDDLECDKLGVIMVTNRLLYPPDGIGFVNDGMFGHAWINTPLGKIKNKDQKRSVTLILDTENFKGPVAYMLPDYYHMTSQWEDQNGNRHPQQTFSNTGMNTGGGAFEWSSVPVYGHQGDERKIRIPKMQFSFNEGQKTVLMSAGKSYTSKADLYTPLDNAMKSMETALDESQLLKLDSGYVHPCNGAGVQDFRLSFEGKALEVGARSSRRLESDGMCSVVVEWDRDSPSLNCNATHCKLKTTYSVSEGSVVKEQDGEWSWSGGDLVPYQSVPSELQGTVSQVFPEHNFFLNYDRRTPEKLCGSNPSKAKFFCRQTSTGDWIGWKWYRFSTQPGLQRMNYSTKKKKFLQRRIVRLHKKMEANSPLNHWLKTPASMPDLVTIDPKLIITPPNKRRYGHVPIVTYQGMEKPIPCSLK
mmetsp:Transcript_30867/g.36000  ORF Transcript_30867/g.36000 Transcript_30867/m.36000 type:complete len:776 (-) Transcript_30867:158-2485(-)